MKPVKDSTLGKVSHSRVSQIQVPLHLGRILNFLLKEYRAVDFGPTYDVFISGYVCASIIKTYAKNKQVTHLPFPVCVLHFIYLLGVEFNVYQQRLDLTSFIWQLFFCLMWITQFCQFFDKKCMVKCQHVVKLF